MPNRNKPRISLALVISKIRQVANEQYNGKVYDNILSIFNSLTTVEKRVLLRGLIGFAFMVEEKILSETDTKDPSARPASPPATSADLQEVEKQLEVQNQQALIGMKVWGFKVGFVLVVMFLLGCIAAVVMLSGDTKILEKLESLKKLYEIVMG